MIICLGAALLVIIALLIKLHLIHRAAGEISTAVRDIRAQGSNGIIGISSRDRQMRALAATFNDELREMNALRIKYEQGDMELKHAITGVSHDLRTPLTAIAGYIDLLERETDPEKQARYISIIKNRTEALRKLSEELLDYSVSASHEQSLELRPMAINRVLEESLASFYQTFSDRGIMPQMSIPEEPVNCLAEPQALGRVLGNVFSNAAKYSDGDLSVTLTPDGEIEIENSASALDSVQVEKLFDRFYTVENARGSTGLGLSIAKTLTERMGGKIDAQYRAGRLHILIKLKKETK